MDMVCPVVSATGKLPASMPHTIITAWLSVRGGDVRPPLWEGPGVRKPLPAGRVDVGRPDAVAAQLPDRRGRRGAGPFSAGSCRGCDGNSVPSGNVQAP